MPIMDVKKEGCKVILYYTYHYVNSITEVNIDHPPLAIENNGDGPRARQIFFPTKWPFPTKWLATGEQFISTGAQWTNFNNLGLILHAVQLITYMKLQILRFFFVTNDCHAYIIFFLVF